MPDAMGEIFNRPINAKLEKKNSDYVPGKKVKKKEKPEFLGLAPMDKVRETITKKKIY